MKKWFKVFSRSNRKAISGVLSMNQRNLEYIYPNNQRQDFPIADNKLLTKRYLSELVPVPKTYLEYDSFFGLRNLQKDLLNLPDFVIKPAQGSGGGGILVVEKKAQTWYCSGEPVSLESFRKHMTDILFGVYSYGLSDIVMVEEKLVSHTIINQISPFGLSDIRIIIYKNQAAMAMLRVPTKQSKGKANLHQGAIGIGIDINSGVTQNAIHSDRKITTHIDTGSELIGVAIPMWEQFLSMGKLIAENIPLGYFGIDLCLTETGPVLLEINVRPGIAIQDVNAQGLRKILRGIDQ